jgi:hypothetical protein
MGAHGMCFPAGHLTPAMFLRVDGCASCWLLPHAPTLARHLFTGTGKALPNVCNGTGQVVEQQITHCWLLMASRRIGELWDGPK